MVAAHPRSLTMRLAVSVLLILAMAGKTVTRSPLMTLPPPPPPRSPPPAPRVDTTDLTAWLLQIYQQAQAQQHAQQQSSPPPDAPNAPYPPDMEVTPFSPPGPPPPAASPPPPRQSPPLPRPPLPAPAQGSQQPFSPPNGIPPPPRSPPPPPRPPPFPVASLDDSPPPQKRPPSPRVLLTLPPPPPPRVAGSVGIPWQNLPPPPPPPSPICSPPTPPPPQGPIDIWIIAGQSNAVGFNDLDYTPMPSPCGDPMPNQMLMYPMSSHSWVDAQTCVGAISCGNPDLHDAVGPDMPFARALISMGISSRVGLIPTAVGGTSLSYSWGPPNGPQWQDMVSTVRYAMAAAGPNAKLRGMMWIQGEADGMFAGSAGSYYNNLQSFVWALRNFTQPYHSSLPIVMALMSTTNRGQQFPYIGWVRDSQAFPNPGTPNILKVDMEGLDFFFQDMGYGPQWTHLSKKGACDLGTNMATAWAASGLQNTS